MLTFKQPIKDANFPVPEEADELELLNSHLDGQV